MVGQRWIRWVLLFLLLSPVAVEAQNGPEIDLFGQVRPRFEGRTPVDEEWSAFTSMRVRAGIEAGFEGDFRVVLQFQDVRLFGEETNTLSDYRADNLDLHQGFIELFDVPSIGGSFKVGRQEMALGEQRLVGAVNWTQQGRSFDGFRYSTPGDGDVKLDLFLMKVREEAASTHDYESTFAGAYGSASLGEAGSLDVFGFLNRDGREDNGSEVTVGGLWRGEAFSPPPRWRKAGPLGGHAPAFKTEMAIPGEREPLLHYLQSRGPGVLRSNHPHRSGTRRTRVPAVPVRGALAFQFRYPSVLA